MDDAEHARHFAVEISSVKNVFPFCTLFSSSQGKSFSLMTFYRAARNTMNMCFSREPDTAEVEVRLLFSTTEQQKAGLCQIKESFKWKSKAAVFAQQMIHWF